MAPSDYTSSGGGALKLKGAGVEKKKKKKKQLHPKDDTNAGKDDQSLDSGGPALQTSDDQIREKAGGAPSGVSELSEELKDDPVEYKAKTEAERRHEERRRQRLHERLKRDGVKTHKERVEELNRYLSAQSDHHDMPKIGPG